MSTLLVAARECHTTFTGICWAPGAGADLQDGMTVQRAAALRPVPAPTGGLVTA